MLNKLIWVPRILMFLYIIMFFLLATDAGPLGFFIEAAPAILFLILIIILWRKVKLQGIILIILGLATMLMFNTYNDLIAFVLVTLPPIVAGIINMALFWKRRVLDKA